MRAQDPLDPCHGPYWSDCDYRPYLWAATNCFGPPVQVPGFNTRDDIWLGVCVPIEGPNQLPRLADKIYPQFLVPAEWGARFHVENNPNNAYDARVFEVNALVKWANPGATLKAHIRPAPPPGVTYGEHVDDDLPVIQCSLTDFSPQPNQKDFCWVKALIDLGFDDQGHARQLPTGDYYFCVTGQLPAQGWYNNWYYLAAERVGSGAGLFTFGNNLSWYVEQVDPIIVIRFCDSNVINAPPVADAWVDGCTTVQTGTQVTFDGQYSRDPDDQLTDCTFGWDFGDGDTALGMRVTHTYDDPNDYTVGLTVTDPHGAQDQDQVTVKVTSDPPPIITQIRIKRSNGTYIDAIHQTDTNTVLYFEATAFNSDGTQCNGDICGYSWLDNGEPLAHDSNEPAPSGTIDYLGITEVRLHNITLEVTDPNTAITVPKTVRFRVSELPPLAMTTGVPVWGPLDFAYEVSVASSLTVPYLDLTCDGQLDVIDEWGNVVSPWPIYVVNFYPSGMPDGYTYSFTGLRRLNTFTWFSDDCKHPNTFGNILPSTTEKLRVRATNLKDANAHNLPPIVSNQENVTATVPDDKVDLYTSAAWHYCWSESAKLSSAVHAAEAAAHAAVGDEIGAGICTVAAVLEAIHASYEAGEHEDECAEARDPIVPDPNYEVTVPLIIEPPAALSVCTLAGSPPGTVELAEAGEADAVVSGARAAYGASLNKLAGLYDNLNPLDPNFPFFAELQGSEVVRYAQITAQALDRAYDAWAEATAAQPITAAEFIDGQEQVAQNGWPELMLDELELLEVNIGEFTADFLAADPNEVTAAWNAGPPGVLNDLGESLMSQSYFAAPAGLVLVGITQPYNNAGVSGDVTIDARVVHKKSEYDCVYGDTIITNVILDQGQPQQVTIAQVPPPPVNCDGLSPAPSAIPPGGLTYDTDQLAEGPHTITVTAQDSAPPPPTLQHFNTDTITFILDRTPPTLTITSPDVDPNAPGIQVFAGDRITYTAADNGSGLAGPADGELVTLAGTYVHTVCVADRAGHTATADVEVIRPHLDNGVVRAAFTDYGTSGDRIPHETATSADIAWLPISTSTQVYSWEGNLRYDDGAGIANHLLADPNEFGVTYGLHRDGAVLESCLQNGEFRIVARHSADGALLRTELELTNISGRELAAVNLAWLLDADLALPYPDPCCASFPWLGFGSGRWFAPAGQGMQTNLNDCAGIVPASLAIRHVVRLDGSINPSHWTVSNPSGFRGSTCAFDGPAEGEPRYLFALPFDDTAGCVGFDQDLGIVTDFEIASWPDDVAHTFTYTLTFCRPGDADADGDIDAADFGALTGCLDGPGVGPVSAACEIFDFLCDDDVDLDDVATFQAVFPGSDD